MDEKVISDLKLFITATMSQQTSDIRKDISKLGKKIDELSTSVAEALDTSNDSVESRSE